MTERHKKVFESIKFYDRYKSIVIQSTSESRLDEPKQELIELVIGNLGYEARFFRAENFYQVKADINHHEFILNLIFRIGRVESVYFAKSKKSGLKLGGVAMRICKQLDLLRGIQAPKSLGAPTFSSYIELGEILEQLLLLFEDFKSEVISSTVLVDNT